MCQTEHTVWYWLIWHGCEHFFCCTEWDHGSSFWDVCCHFASHACMLVASRCLADTTVCSTMLACGHGSFFSRTLPILHFCRGKICSLQRWIRQINASNYKAVGLWCSEILRNSCEKLLSDISCVVASCLQSEGQLEGQGVPQSIQSPFCKRESSVSRSRGRGWDESLQGRQKLELHWEKPRGKEYPEGTRQRVTPEFRGWGESTRQHFSRLIPSSKLVSLVETEKK